MDRYDEEWSLLWWVRVDGHARIVETGPEMRCGIDMLVDKYAQYRPMVPTGPLIAIEAASWISWEAAGH